MQELHSLRVQTRALDIIDNGRHIPYEDEPAKKETPLAEHTPLMVFYMKNPQRPVFSFVQVLSSDCSRTDLFPSSLLQDLGILDDESNDKMQDCFLLVPQISLLMFFWSCLMPCSMFPQETAHFAEFTCDGYGLLAEDYH